MLRLLPALLAVGLLLAAGLWLVRPSSAPPLPEATLTLAEAMGGGADEGFSRALTPRPFHFPADHGPHPTFKNEWWYWTGNLRTPEGRRFGYQLTFFRSALSPQATPRASAWGTQQVYLAHFTLTDVEAGRFHSAERLARGALGLAGAEGPPLHVWVEDWSATAQGEGLGPLRLVAADGERRVELVLEEGKPPVPQGREGLSQKGPEPGNASHYYSLTRMPTRGTVSVGPQRFTVEGESWMDREWSTSALSPGQQGWDWFSLQLSDGTELMAYQLRRKDGTVDPHSSATLVDTGGRPLPLAADAVRLAVRSHWQSPASGVRYPAAWRLEVPAQQLSLTVRPLLAGQELATSVRYWEGAVEVEGERAGRPLTGRGYVELTGYAEAASGGGGAARGQPPASP